MKTNMLRENMGPGEPSGGFGIRIHLFEEHFFNIQLPSCIGPVVLVVQKFWRKMDTVLEQLVIYWVCLLIKNLGINALKGIFLAYLLLI